jgi:putative transcriptional regulator
MPRSCRLQLQALGKRGPAKVESPMMWSTQTVELAAPTLLVAMPSIQGDLFAQSVVLLLQHDANGSMGLILNQRSTTDLRALCTGLGVTYRGAVSNQVHVGGPVEPERAFILHASEHRGPETSVVLPPVALSFSMESLQMIAQAPPDDLRVCVGYAGWGAGQLAEEISRGDWMITPALHRFIFDTPPAAMWHQALKQMGIEPLHLMQTSARN